METSVSDLPADLAVLCYADLDPKSEEGQLLLPPQEIMIEIGKALSDGAMSELLTSWIDEQRRVFDEVNTLIEHLPPFEGDDMPGWMGTRWAITFGCPWSAGLADALREGKAWLASQ
jgi:hypothetical protein